MRLPSSDRHVYGHLRDPQGHRRTPVHRLVGAGSYPRSASLEAYVPEVMDQGQTGRCVGYGKAGAIYTSGQGTIFLASPTGIYRLARAIDRIPNLDGSLPPLIDEGSMPNQADRAIGEYGVSPFDPAIDGPDISDEELNHEPTLEELEQDSAVRLIGSYALDETAPDFEAQVCRTLAAGYAISFALPDTDDGFENYSGGVLGGPVGRVYGGHELFAFGYELTGTNDIRVRGQNSWGKTNWGVGGRFEGNRAFMSRWVDVQAMRVLRAQGRV
jgi:hypothetical protein